MYLLSKPFSKFVSNYKITKKLDTNIKNKIWNLFESEQKNICVMSHTSPDGDAVGAALSMSLMLKKFNHSVSVIVPNSFPDYYAWLPEADQIIIEKNNHSKAVAAINEADLLVYVDLNAIRRVEGLETVLAERKCPTVLFDHHEFSGEVFDYTFSQINVSSTCELIYDFFSSAHKDLIDSDIAKCLYTGIVTDTGCFFHGNMNENTFIIVSELMKIGLEITRLNQLIYNNFSESRLRLLGHSISNKLNIIEGYPAAYMTLTQAELNKFKYNEGDTEGIVNYGLTIKGINISALFIERRKYIKISFRSEGNFDVNKIAVKYFNGGGHKNASGAYFYGNIDDAVALFVKAVSEL